MKILLALTSKLQLYLCLLLLFVSSVGLALENQFFEEGLKQTVSVGVVEAKEDLTVDRLLSLVDEKLYLAKDTGRNKIMS